MATDRPKAVSFFLNETHELARGEREGGGRLPKFAPVNWTDKGNRLVKSLSDSVKVAVALPDPSKANHYYLLAKPQPMVRKLHESKDVGITEEEVPTSFAGKDSRVFSRLGVDLLRVTDEGSAIVHVTPSHATQLETTASNLASFGAREQARWVTLESFESVPTELKIDLQWFNTLVEAVAADSVIELQPLLNRAEVDSVVRSLFASIQINAPGGQGITGSGSDFSGRQWLRAKLTRDALNSIAHNYMAVQSLHSPLLSNVAGTLALPLTFSTNIPTQPSPYAPRIAIVDTGVPANHAVLAPFRQGEFRAPYNQGGSGQHGSLVASRAVFGDLSIQSGSPCQQALRFFDVNVSFGPSNIDDKQLLPALQAVVGTSPDIRVFNLSFDSEPLALLSPILRSERLLLVQDLDNFAFQNDVLFIVSAGNTPQGLLPNTPYPNHVNEEVWSLGAYACSFNALTCGSFVGQLSSNGGVVNDLGWPSPFSRIGPGIAGSAKPDFSAPGGNASSNYSCGPGMGVIGLNANGVWAESCGTSLAAPLLAREAALAFQLLESVSAPGSRPYASTVKAFLVLTATPPIKTFATQELVSRSLGYGRASATRLAQPDASSAVFLWQGLLDDKNDLALVQIPIPRPWLASAKKPRLRLVLAADVPVNAAAYEFWASRKVSAKLRASPHERALTPQKRKVGDTYPLIDQQYSFSKLDLSKVASDIWLVEINYEDIADYLPSMAFASQQKVSFVAELYDDSTQPESPQNLLKAMPITSSMNRLSEQPASVKTPVMLRY